MHADRRVAARDSWRCARLSAASRHPSVYSAPVPKPPMVTPIVFGRTAVSPRFGHGSGATILVGRCRRTRTTGCNLLLARRLASEAPAVEKVQSLPARPDVTLSSPLGICSQRGMQSSELRHSTWTRRPSSKSELHPHPGIALDTRPDDGWSSNSELDALELEYCKVKVRGKLDTEEVILLGPRSPQAHVPSAMKIGKTVTGYNMIQAMTLPSGRRVLVNRGWIMRDDRAADLVRNVRCLSP